MTYEDLKAALSVFGLGERATLQEIKTRYRDLAKRHHPDCGDREDTEEIYRVNEANRVILEYVESYRYCFSEQEYLEQDPEEQLRRRFMADPLWGKG
jgi:DnaJ-class molecular chaperone